MTDFWFFLTSTALFDSLSTMIQIVLFVYLLSSPRPLGNSLAFLAGTSLAYLGCGLVFLYHVRAINAFFAQYIPNETSLPNSQYYTMETLVGVGLLLWVIVVSVRRKPRRSAFFDRLTVLAKLLNPVTAFLLGAFLSVTGFPASIPYLGAMEKLVAFLGPTGAIPGTLYYNFVYAVPVLVALAVYLVLRRHDEAAAGTLHRHTQRWAPLMNRAITGLLGLLFAIDGALFFLRGSPLLTSKFF